MEIPHLIEQITLFTHELESLKKPGSAKCHRPKAISKLKSEASLYFQSSIFPDNNQKQEKANTTETNDEITNNEETNKDGRKKIENVLDWPNSVHCLLKMKFDSQSYTGTATLIAPNLAITAAHNLFNADTKEEALLEELMLFPAAEGTIFNYSCKINKFFYPEKYVTSKGTEEDYGLLVLEKEMGSELGYLGLGLIDEEMLKKMRISITGYPNDKVKNKPFTHEMWGMEGNAHHADKNFIYYTINTFGGQSGSGVICHLKENEYCVVGTHVLGSELFNKGTYLTEERINQILLWLKAYLNELELRKSVANYNNQIELKFNENITNEVINKLVSTISKYEDLHSLKLIFKNTNIANKSLRKLVSGIDDQDNLTRLEINVESCQNMDWKSLDTLNIVLTCKKFSSIFLNFAGCNNIDDTIIDPLAYLLENSDNISKLFLNLGETKVTNYKLIEMAKNLKKNQIICSIELDVDSYYDAKNSPAIKLQKSANNEKIVSLRLIPNQDNINLKRLFETLKFHQGNPKISNIELNLTEKSLKDETILLLSAGLANFQSIPYLKLNLEWNTFFGESIKLWKEILINKNNISELLITFPSFPTYQMYLIEYANILKENLDISIIEFDLDYFYDLDQGQIIKFSNLLSNQKSFYFRFNFNRMDSCNPKDKLSEIIEMAKNLKKNPRMTTFDLNLELKNIDDEIIFSLLSVLKHFKNITDFKLNLFSTNMNDEYIVLLMDKINNLKNITTFDLNLYGTKITKKSITRIVEIVKNMTNLIEFNLNLKWTDIGDTSLEKLAELFKDMKNLEKIALYFYKTKVTDSSVLKLAESLKNKVNLRDFTLSLGETKVGDSSLVALTKAFKNQQNIKNFVMDLSGTNVGESSLVKLAEAFRDKQNIDHFEIQLFNTHTGDESLAKFGEIFGNKQNIQKFYMYIERTKVTKSSVNALKSIIKADDTDILAHF